MKSLSKMHVPDPQTLFAGTSLVYSELSRTGMDVQSELKAHCPPSMTFQIPVPVLTALSEVYLLCQPYSYSSAASELASCIPLPLATALPGVVAASDTTSQHTVASDLTR